MTENFDLEYRIHNRGMSRWQQRKQNLQKITASVDGDTIVGLAQAGLVALGYDLGDYGEGGVDGDFGSLTEAAVKHFKGLIGEERTEELDEKTVHAIYMAAISGLTQDDLKSKPMGLIGKSRYWTREQWGAKEALKVEKENVSIYALVLHHTAGGERETIQGIQRYHMTPENQRGPKGGPWDDIGYHVSVKLL